MLPYTAWILQAVNSTFYIYLLNKDIHNVNNVSHEVRNVQTDFQIWADWLEIN